jgi:hypothetical protein
MHILNQQWFPFMFISLFAPAIVVSVFSSRCPVCDLFFTGGIGNVCRTCNARFEIEEFKREDNAGKS